MKGPLLEIADDQLFQGASFTRLRFGVKLKGVERKIFYVMHRGDGSMYVETPYFKGVKNYFGVAEIPQNKRSVDIEHKKIGLTKNWTPKFAYKYSTGECHFSKTGPDDTEVKKFKTFIKPLGEITEDCHIFTVQIQNIKSFEILKGSLKERGKGIINAIYDLKDDEPAGLKFVGRVTTLEDFKKTTTYHGDPKLTTKGIEHYYRENGELHPVIPYALRGTNGKKLIFYIICRKLLLITPASKGQLLFLGGFDDRAEDIKANAPLLFLRSDR